MRWGLGRDRYTVDPGLYALNQPGPASPVLVTANYKLSFDALRAPLGALAAWILVLDTRGINVWCAAGKGTFSTDEVVRQVEASHLARLVEHRRLLLPQLGAPGVAAHEVQARCGFQVRWGPVRSDDLPSFLAGGQRATPEMRRKRFDLRERIVLIPVELKGALLPTAIALVAALLLSVLVWPGPAGLALQQHGVPLALAVLGGVLSGAVLQPMLLPWLPGRAFALKGLVAGLPVALGLAAATWPGSSSPAALLEVLAWSTLCLSVASYLGMMFTGASTFTSLSGVRREMRLALPLQASGLVVALAAWIAARVIGGGVA